MDDEYQVSFRPKQISDSLEKRDGSPPGRLSVHQAARRDLDRYYSILRRDLPTFSRSEAHLICDVLNGILVDPALASGIWSNFYDTEDAVYERHSVDKQQLVERFWAGRSKDPSDVGLCPEEEQEEEQEEE